MKVAILNQPLNNRGDQAAHRAFIHALLEKKPDTEFEVIFLNEKEKNINEISVRNERIKYINITGIGKGSVKCIKLTLGTNFLLFSKCHPLLNSYMKMVRTFDAVICSPGGICMGGFMNWSHIWQLYIAQKFGIKVYYWGRSIGPFNSIDVSHKLFKKISLKLIEKFEYISLRDDISFGIVSQIRKDVFKTVDSAFLECPEAEIPDKIKMHLSKDYIIFVPNELTWHYKFRTISGKRLDNIYLQIIRKIRYMYPNYQIVMLPQTYNQDINDFGYFNKLKNLANEENILVIDEYQNSDIQQAIIKEAKFVIGGRYHSIVFAINNKVPFFSLSYEHKMKGLLDDLNLSECQIDFEKYVLSNIDAEIELPCFEDMREKIIRKSALARDITEKAFNCMIDRL